MDEYRKERFARFAIFSFANSLRSNGTLPNPPIEEERKLKEHSENAVYLDLAQRLNGPGFYIDRKIREFVREYNNRVFMGNGDQQPSSFQLIQDFVIPDEKYLVLRILDEEFYSLDIEYILEKITDPNLDDISKYGENLESGKVYYVNFFGEYEGLKFVGLEDVALFGAAFVRHGDNLSVMVLGGNSGAKSVEKSYDINDGFIDPDRDFLRDRQNSKVNMEFEQLYDFQNLYPQIFLSRFSLERGTALVRYVFNERKDSFDVYTYDREHYTYLSKGPFSEDVDSLSKRFDISYNVLSKYSSVFQFMSMVPSSLFGISDLDELSLVRYPTYLGLNKQKTHVKKIRKKLSQTDARYFVSVGEVLLKINAARKHSIQTDPMKIEQKGYWKTLPFGQLGTGSNGDRVQGKTWVSVHESWFEEFGFEPPENSSNFEVNTGAETNDSGELYVMRSAQHPHDTYKIGFTTKTSEERARQLQSTSGQPDQMNVVQSWSVKAPRKVEGLVHQRLAQYRINPKREFFSVKYSIIRETIENVIDKLQAKL